MGSIYSIDAGVTMSFKMFSHFWLIYTELNPVFLVYSRDGPNPISKSDRVDIFTSFIDRRSAILAFL